MQVKNLSETEDMEPSPVATAFVVDGEPSRVMIILENGRMFSRQEGPGQPFREGPPAPHTPAFAHIQEKNSVDVNR